MPKATPSLQDLASMAAVEDKYLTGEIENQQARLRRSLKRLEARVVNLASTLHKNAAGEVTGYKWTLAQAREFHRELAVAYESIYGVSASANIGRFQAVAQQVQEQFEALGVPAAFGNVQKRTLTALSEQAYQVYHTLGVESQNRIAQAVYDSLIAGIEPAELNQRIAGAITGHKDVRGRPLTQYAELYAQDSTMGVYRSMHQATAEQAGLDHFLYTGTIIEGSRQFCREMLGRVLSREEVAALESRSWDGKSGPALTHCGGYNCRHHWQAVDPEWLDGAGPEEVEAALSDQLTAKA